MSLLARTVLLCVISGLVVVGLARVSAGDSGTAWVPSGMPEFTQRDASAWLNSPPLTSAQLRGQVVLLEVWTFGCVNCQRSIPWLRSLAHRHAPSALRLVGIHTPEFSNERDRHNVDTHAQQAGVTWPIMLDNDQAYWNALHNDYWPAFYLVDKQGQIRALSVGEIHEGDAQAQRLEAQIAGLLKE
ncbi:MAG: redoxin family protein [Tahibacter sp.]